MKFGRLLRCTSGEGLPQMEALFTAYKLLKKKIKKMPSKEQLAALGPEAAADAEQAFVLALSDTLHSLNDTYMEKEETSVIRVERLEHQLATAAGAVELAELHKQLVDFHGEVLLLMHWSILAYTATVKILKKHHKRTGLLVQAPQLGNLLAQPFCSTELLTGIARRVEEDIIRLSQQLGLPTPNLSEPSGHHIGSAATAKQQQSGAAAAAGSADAAGAGAGAACGGGASAVRAAVSAPAGPGGASATAVVAAAAAAAAAAVAKVQGQGLGLLYDVGPDGLDMQLLRQLAAESESGTSMSDNDATAEQDTCVSKERRGEQPHSQQAHLQQHAAGDDDNHTDVQSGPKRQKLEQQEQQSRRTDGDGAAAAAADALPAAAPDATAKPAAGPAAAAAPTANGNHHLLNGAHPAAAAGMGGQQAGSSLGSLGDDGSVDSEAAVGAAGASAPEAQLAPAPGGADAADVAAGGSNSSLCAHEATIMRQTQVALTTWRHLQSTAITPSTVLQGSVPHYPHGADGALTASSAVQ